ncbi:hypothetical protein F2P56_032069, partial [Juglans regia]
LRFDTLVGGSGSTPYHLSNPPPFQKLQSSPILACTDRSNPHPPHLYLSDTDPYILIKHIFLFLFLFSLSLGAFKKQCTNEDESGFGFGSGFGSGSSAHSLPLGFHFQRRDLRQSGCKLWAARE